LQGISRRKPILKNRTPIEIEEAAVALAIEQPAWGQVRVSDALKRRGLSISPAGLARHRQLDLPGIGDDRLLPITVTPLAGLLADQVMIHLGVEKPFGQRSG
jgi:hypothetical protein